MKVTLLIVLVLFSFLLGSSALRGESNGKALGVRSTDIPVLLYHRFGPIPADPMTVTTAAFESQLKYLSDNGYVIITLRQLVDYHLGNRPAPPVKSLVLTVDDGHKSVYTDMFPLLKKNQVPATLFIYPSAVSNATYAMTWGQLREMKETGLIDLQSHTFWHPNFRKEKERLKSSEYEHLVEMQLKKSKQKLERELGTLVDMLAWPFGIYNDDLMDKAAEAGYVAAFTMERRHACITENVRSLPRYLMTHSDKGAFERILVSGNRR